MSFRLNGKLAITFLFALALLALASPSSANAMSPESPRRRDHPDLNRMIKMRAAAPPVARQGKNSEAVGAGANPQVSSTSSTPSSTPTSLSTSNTPQSSSAALASQIISPLLSLVSTSASSTSSSSASSTSSTASAQTTTSSTTSSSAPTSSATPSSQRTVQLAPTNTPSASVDSVTLTSHVPAASSSSSSSADNRQLGGSSLSHTTIMIIIILAASIGGCAVVWTIIRKWKFRPSSQFEDRLEPVNWQPAEHESGLPTHHRMPSNASSFHSAGHDNMMDLSRSNSGGAYNATRGLSPLPDHDFTAGAATLAPGGGYADLARGPSPQPLMQEALQRGPSFNHGYDDYVAPAHYQGGQEAYDHGNAGPRY